MRYRWKLMKYRWKLLLLLILISILPIIGLRFFGVYHVHRMANTLSSQLRESQVKDARCLMLQWINNYQQILATKRQQVEMALVMQAMELQRHFRPESLLKAAPKHTSKYVAIEKPLPESAALQESRFFQERTSLCICYPQDPSESSVKQDAFQLAESHLVFHAINLHLGGLSLRHCSGLENGAAVVYPCNGKQSQPASDPRGSIWYQNAYEEKLSVWSNPYIDPECGKRVMAASMPLETEKEQIYGVTSIVVPLEPLLETFTLISGPPAEARIFLTSLAKRAKTGKAALEILVDRKKGEVFGGGIFQAPQKQWLHTEDSAQMDLILRSIAARGTTLSQITFEGRDCFWGCGPLYRQGTAFIMVVPSDQIVASTRNMQDALISQVNRVENYTAVFLIFLVAINIGVALLFSRSATHPLRALASAFNQHLSQLKEHFRIQQALNVAMEIQQTLLPLEPPRIDGLDIYGMTRYCEKIGGDYFDYLCVGEKNQQRLFVAVGDVSGHGIPPALLMATVRALLRYRTDAASSIGKIISDVNRKFSEDVENSGRFFTLFLAGIDLMQLRIKWVRAGHDPALLYDPEEDSFRSLRGDGIPLGVDPGYVYQESDFSVRAGQILIIGTDGIWETRNCEGDFFGKDRLYAVIRRHGKASARKITLAVIDALKHFRGKELQEDDVTITVVKFER